MKNVLAEYFGSVSKCSGEPCNPTNWPKDRTTHRLPKSTDGLLSPSYFFFLWPSFSFWRSGKSLKSPCYGLCDRGNKKKAVLNYVRLFAAPWTVAHQAPVSMGFPRQEDWSGLPFPSPGDLPNPGIKPTSPVLAGEFFTTESAGKPCCYYPTQKYPCALLEWFHFIWFYVLKSVCILLAKLIELYT